VVARRTLEAGEEFNLNHAPYLLTVLPFKQHDIVENQRAAS